MNILTKRFKWVLVGGIQLAVCFSAAARQPDPLVCADQGFPAFCFMTTDIAKIQFGSMSWADFDVDGDMDLLVSGNRSTRSDPDPILSFYRNNGDIARLGDPPAPNLPPAVEYVASYEQFDSEFRLHDGYTALGDFDGDNRVDAVVTGSDEDSVLSTVFFRNVSSGSMAFEFMALHPGLRAASIAFGDADNDGDLDLALSGLDENDDAKLWIAYLSFDPLDGPIFTFTDVGLPGAAHGQLVWGDYDGDGDNDLLVSGNREGQGYLRIYRNDDGAFADSGLNLPAGLFGSADWGDYDGDGDLDIVVAGGLLDPFLLRGFVAVYRNDGGAYVEAAYLDGVFHGSASWIDYDNDGDLDAFVSGGTRVSGDAIGIFLINTGVGFERGQTLGGGLFGSAALADYDFDGDIDMMVFGMLATRVIFAQVYRNEIAQPNSAPSTPTNATAVVTGNTVQLSWSPSTDDHTPTAGLTYNVRIGSDGNVDRMPSMSTPDGRRLVTADGNVGHALTWSVSNLEAGTWYWQVQAIDGSGVGSPFTEPQQFVVDPQ